MEPRALTHEIKGEGEPVVLIPGGLGIETAHFAGWSAGGKASIEFALAYPERVRTLTLVEPEAYWILEQLGAPDPDVERTDSFMQALFGKEVTEDDLASRSSSSPGSPPRRRRPAAIPTGSARCLTG
jgi:pimeloyl-ACP methyl ester carboxylesterase